MVEAAWSWSLNAQIPSSLDKAHEVIDKLLVALTEAGWDGRDYFHIQMAVEEALVNAVKHGNEEDQSKFVDLDFKVARDRVFMKITDQGHGFDPEALPDPRDDDHLECINGRGVMLIKEMMDQVQYNTRGNQIEMLKYRQPSD